VYNKPVSLKGARGQSLLPTLALNTMNIRAGTPVQYSVDVAGKVTMELIAINGAKIGTIMQENVTSGVHSFNWNGKTIDGKHVSSTFAVLRLSSPSGTITKAVMTGR